MQKMIITECGILCVRYSKKSSTSKLFYTLEAIRHRDMKIRSHPALLNYAHVSKADLYGYGFGNCFCIALLLPCRHDDSKTTLCITMSARAWERLLYND